MATKTPPHIWSNLTVPPGNVLEEELAARSMTKRELARKSGQPVQVINEIVRGNKSITLETALGLEKVLAIGAHFWTNLESLHQMTLARNKERDRLE